MVWLRRGVWAVAAVLLVLALGWLVVPPLLKWQLPLRLEAALGRPVSLGAVHFQPWRLNLVLEQLEIAGAARGSSAAPAPPALLQVQRIEANASIASLLRLAPVIESLRIEAPVLHLARHQDGHYSIDDLLNRFRPPVPAEPAAEPARFALYNLQVQQARLVFDDQPVGRQHQVEALSLDLPFLSNLPADIEVKVAPRLVFQLGQTRFDSQGEATPFASTRAGELALKVDKLDLAPYRAYLPADLPLQLVRGLLSADLKLQFALAADGNTTLQLSGQLDTQDVALAPPGAADGSPALLAWKQLSLGLKELQPLKRQLAFSSLVLQSPELRLQRDAAGRWVGLTPGGRRPVVPPAASASPAAPAASAAPADAPAPWQVSLDSLDLQDGRIAWLDQSVQPAAALQVDSLVLQTKAVRWPMVEPVDWTLDARLADGAAKLSATGQASDRQAQARLVLDSLPLGPLAPYLRQASPATLDGALSAKATLDWAAGPAGPSKLGLQLAEAQIDRLRLALPPPASGQPATEPALQMQRLQLTDLVLDLPARQISLARLQLQQPRLDLARSAAGRWNLQDALPAATAASAASAASATSAAPPGTAAAASAGSASAATPAPWRVQLQDLQLQDAELRLADATVPGAAEDGPLRLRLAEMQLGLQGLAFGGPPGGKQLTAPLKLQWRGLVDGPGSGRNRNDVAGRFDWAGEVQPAPVHAKGRLRLERLPLHLLAPYADSGLKLELRQAQGDFQGTVLVSQEQGGWQVDTAGDLRLGRVRVASRAPRGEAAAAARPASGAAQVEAIPLGGSSNDPDGGRSLVRWQALDLSGLRFTTTPGGRPRLEVKSSTLTDFFARLLVTEQGRLNLQDVAGTPVSPTTGANPADTAVASAAPPAPAASTAPAAPGTVQTGTAVNRPPRLPIDLELGPTRLVNGQVDFTDRFVRPNYSAALSGLNGQLGAFRSDSREMATLELQGRAAGTAELDIRGQVNPFADPLALDIQARASDLELAPLSPYAGKYAGYAIERGKLSMELAYRIDDNGLLEASNKVVLNQLTFGDRIESPQATKLPVLLAVALLKDRNGVIDINLPISGSVRDPQFSVGQVVWRVLGNLLARAITAPFALLTGGASGSESLDQLVFEPGTSRLADGAPAAIDKVAKALTDRPALSLTVTGMADLAAERAAFQQAGLDTRLRAEQRRELSRTGKPVDNADALPPLTEAERLRLLTTVYQQSRLPDRPRNALGLLKDLPPEEMAARLRQAVVVNEEAMRALALQRGLVVREALSSRGLPTARLFLASPRVQGLADGGAVAAPGSAEAASAAAAGASAGWVPHAALKVSTN